MLDGHDEKAMDLKLFHFPQAFYKYRKLNDDTFKSLEEKKFWVADVNTLNDPFECSLLFNQNEFLRNFFFDEYFPKRFFKKFNIEITKAELNNIHHSVNPYLTYSEICLNKGVILNINNEQFIEIANATWNDVRINAKKTIQICSFTERYDSLLMWAHYAEQHKGICIEYDFNESDADRIRPFIQPVFYSNKIFTINSIGEVNAINNIMASICKSKDWEYEQEWRLTIFAKSQIEGNMNLIKAPIPKAIILGSRFNLNTDDVKCKIDQIVKEQNIPIYQMNIHSSQYKLIKNEL